MNRDNNNNGDDSDNGMRQHNDNSALQATEGEHFDRLRNVNKMKRRKFAATEKFL